MMTPQKTELTNCIIAGLPGVEEGYSLSQLQLALDTYQNIGEPLSLLFIIRKSPNFLFKI